MSSELNKIFCAILSAILVYLLASFLSELLYNVDKKKATKLSYSIENVKDENKDIDDKNIDSELKIITELDLNKLLEKADLEKGETFVNKNCASCHDLNLSLIHI